jgi:hypothetical protein
MRHLATILITLSPVVPAVDVAWISLSLHHLLRRWNDQKPSWPAVATEEWDAMKVHVHTNDFPETTRTGTR